MTMPRWEAPHKTPEAACQAAQGSCIRERGDFCQAYGGINCKSCEKYEAGIQRRRKKYVQEKKQTIRSIVSQDGNIIRLRKVNDNFLLEVGKFFDSPPIFIRERSSLIYNEEMAFVRDLLASVRT